MTANYDTAERQKLAEALRGGEPLVCPRCGAAVARSPVAGRAALPYVRRREWLICTGCKRSVAVDVKP